MAVELHAADFDGRHWPTYRPRRSVAARRLGSPTCVDGTIHLDGYLVRDAHGVVGVMAVADFEAVYELASRDD
jgi:hypothetical protein